MYDRLAFPPMLARVPVAHPTAPGARSVDRAGSHEVIQYPLPADTIVRRRLPVHRPAMHFTERVVGTETRRAVVEVAATYRPEFPIDRDNRGRHAHIFHADGRPPGRITPLPIAQRGIERDRIVSFNDRLPRR